MTINSPVDIDLLPTRDIVYSGVCLRKSMHLFILINFDDRKKEFDGYTVFRNDEISKYRCWTPQEIAKIKCDNRDEFRNLPGLKKMNTFYSCLKFLPDEMLVEFYTAKDYQSYYVGKITSITRTTINFKLIDENANWIGYKKVKIQDINFFGFGTLYSKKLMKRNQTRGKKSLK